MKRLIAIILSFIYIFVLSGCSEKHKDAYIYFELSEKPYSIDAQTASTDSELLIVRNIYEGLMRYDLEGNIVCGAAESYEKNGLTYTFRIREDAKWSTEEPLTAHDFAFGLKRAVLPETKSPFANRLFSIVGAQEISLGGADASSLGVTVLDDKTLQIELKYENDDFLEILTDSVCMPCNEEFFNECVGKYGLESKYTISNGSYSIRKWAKDENFGIRLYKNKHYNGDFQAENSAVYLSCRDDAEPVDLLERDKIDLAFIDGSSIKSAESVGLEVKQSHNICWFMTIGGDYDEKIIKGFSHLVSPEVYKSSLSDGFSVAESIYPPIVTSHSSAKGIGFIGYDLEKGKELFSAAIKKMNGNVLPSTMLYYYNDPSIKPAVTSIIGHFQQNLSAFINIEASDDLSYLRSQLKTNNLNFAIFPVKAYNSDPAEFLMNFSQKSDDPVVAQNEILSQGKIIPIATQSTNIALAKTIKQVLFMPYNGYVDFSFVIKVE